MMGIKNLILRTRLGLLRLSVNKYFIFFSEISVINSYPKSTPAIFQIELPKKEHSELTFLVFLLGPYWVLSPTWASFKGTGLQLYLPKKSH